MKVGIINYPGSNCIEDTKKYFPNHVIIWHNESILPSNIDLIVIPGGFSFGDRYYKKATEEFTMDPGRMAIESPVSLVIKEANVRNIPILGICNGFQILIKLGLLTGRLVRNDCDQFVCKKMKCFMYEQEMELYIANGYGKYIPDEDDPSEILMRYENNQIAGVKRQNVYGIMPHPERTSDELFKLLLELDIKIYETMVSEHVSYKSTRKYLKQFLTKGQQVVVGPGENAGIVDIGNNYGIAMRIESHNHPTAIDPYQGAATGVGGILRDIFTMGARPIALLDFLRFSKDSHLIKDTIKGIADYGNCVGIPNVGGDYYVHDCYKQNPLLNVAAIGLVKLDEIIYGRVENEGDILLYVGSKTGKDGVGGTSMASCDLHDDIDKNSIQHGDPFLEKLLLEACLEVNHEKLLVGMQDVGAGGILCSTIEMVERGRNKTKENLGCVVNLEKVPLKEKLSFTQIMISETQERMIMAVKPMMISRIKTIFSKWDLECHEIGFVTSDGKYTLKQNSKTIFSKSMQKFVYPEINWELINYERSLIPQEKVKNKQLWEQYDSSIGCRTIKGPLESGDYSILDIPEAGCKIMLTWGSSVQFCYDHMIKKLAKPVCLINSLNFGNPKFRIKEFVDKVDEIAKQSKELNIPVIGGNVSLYNTTGDKSIDGTVVIVMMGIL